MSNTPNTEAMKTAQELIALATASTNPMSVAGTNYTHVMVPQGFRAQDISADIEKQRTTPSRRTGTVQLKDVGSLLMYCADMNGADVERAVSFGYIYADPDNRRITAVFNDHRGVTPGWRDHRAEFKAEFTAEFKKWMDNNAKQFTQSEFAEFIEDNMADITEPAATAMLEMATTIQAKTDINFSSAKRLQNGQVQLQYTEAIDARAGANGAMEIPKEFALGLRIFKNGEGYKLKARLKYRLHGGTVKFWYELDRPERSIEDAFTGYVATLREKSGYQVLIGTP